MSIKIIIPYDKTLVNNCSFAYFIKIDNQINKFVVAR